MTHTIVGMAADPETTQKMIRAVHAAERTAEQIKAAAEKKARQVRAEAIRKARDAGVPMTVIARELGITRGRLYQLLDEL